MTGGAYRGQTGAGAVPGVSVWPGTRTGSGVIVNASLRLAVRDDANRVGIEPDDEPEDTSAARNHQT
jgi:hypothetical protein